MIFATRFLFSLFLFSSYFCFGMNSSSDDLEFFDDLALGDNDGDVQMQDAAPQTMLHAVCYDADNALIELRSLDDATMQLWRKGKPISAS